MTVLKNIRVTYNVNESIDISNLFSIANDDGMACELISDYEKEKLVRSILHEEQEKRNNVFVDGASCSAIYIEIKEFKVEQYAIVAGLDEGKIDSTIF